MAEVEEKVDGGAVSGKDPEDRWLR